MIDQPPRQRLHPLIPPERALGDAPVDEDDGDAAHRAPTQRIGPEFRFQDDEGAWVKTIERSSQDDAEIKGPVKKNIFLREEA